MISLGTMAWAAGLTMGFSLVFTWAVRSVDYRRGWVAKLQADRWHKKPTAIHGGVGIWLGLAAAAALLGPLAGVDWGTDAAWLAVGSTLAFCIGLRDDHYRLSPGSRIVAELLIASFVIAGAGWLIPLTPRFLVNTLLTYFWFVSIINAVNLLDNMDGLAAGVVAIAAASLLGLLAVTGVDVPLLTTSLLMLLGALLGYLVFNSKPASIFMGDSGSLMLGYLIAALSVGGMHHLIPRLAGTGLVSAVLPLALPVAILAVPIFDTTLVTVTRKWNGRAAMSGGRDHSSHRLVALGCSERTAVSVLYGLGALGGLCALALALWPGWAIVPAGFFTLGMVLLGTYLGAVPMYAPETDRPRSRAARIGMFVHQFLVRRQILALVTDVFLIGSAYYGAFILRYEGDFSGALPAILYSTTLPFVIPLTLLVFFVCRVYQAVWRTISVADLKNYGAAFLALPLIIAGYHLLQGYDFSISLILIFDLLLGTLLVGSRLFYRLLDQIVLGFAQRQNGNQVPVLIYGAGARGRTATEELLRDPERRFHIVGLIDDNPMLHGRSMWGFKVLGGRDKLPPLLDRHANCRVVISTPQIDAAALAQELSAHCGECTVYRMELDLRLIEPVPRENGARTHMA